MTPENGNDAARDIERLELQLKLRDSRIDALRRERMEMLFPRVESLEEQVKSLEEQVVKLTGERSLLLEALQLTRQQLDHVVGLVGAVIDAAS